MYKGGLSGKWVNTQKGYLVVCLTLQLIGANHSVKQTSDEYSNFSLADRKYLPTTHFLSLFINFH